MSQGTPEEPWSPAHNPHAIAMSEAQRARWTIDLCAGRIRGGRDVQQQIDARQFVVALRQLLYAAEMQQQASNHLPPPARAVLGRAIQNFKRAAPGLVDARNVLVHFHDYAHGNTPKQRKYQQANGADAAAAAAHFWGGGYNPATGSFTVGTYEIHIDTAQQEAGNLFDVIYAVARAVDNAKQPP